jgi:hypothetical protein
MRADYFTYSDKDLFARIAQGEETAFTGIYLRYAQKLMPRVARLLDSQSWASNRTLDHLKRRSVEVKMKKNNLLSLS